MAQPPHAIEARLERRGNSVGCPMARIRRGAKNAGETRGRGSLSLWPCLGVGQPVEGVAARERTRSPCSPPRSHFSAVSCKSGRSQGRLVGAQPPTSTLRPHCPVSSSSDSTAIGGMTHEVDLPPGDGSPRSDERRMTPRQSRSSPTGDGLDAPRRAGSGGAEQQMWSGPKAAPQLFLY
jgi:hypothetical protein